MSHYDTLDIAPNADEATIKRAYRRKSSEHHPDRGGDTTQMAAINRAYETLSDPDKRKRYDVTGEDQIQHPAERQAMELVMQTIMRLVDQHSESQDVIAFANRDLKANQSQFKQQQSIWRQQIRDLERRRKRLKHKGAGPNFLDDMFASRIEQFTAQIKDFDENIALCDQALELLKGYEWEGKMAQSLAALYGQATNAYGQGNPYATGWNAMKDMFGQG